MMDEGSPASVCALDRDAEVLGLLQQIEIAVQGADPDDAFVVALVAVVEDEVVSGGVVADVADGRDV